ncbi:PQQ-dependent sugar dehydrogenase [Demequina rhizosphaerae]|uniref:PQQ-dependent sugar dehydrogenase n=1 Tax=Demequina rhizosphaerae TaxID=1638985 RepID=UPI000783B67C|nr:PQQ-dependent sugar dehydrogenase [Demequina rhizosphaerae]
MSFRPRIVALACALPLTLAACSSASDSAPTQSAERIVSGTTPTTEIAPTAPTEIGGAATASVTSQEVVATGLDSPWSIAPMADGSLLVSERDSALIKRVRAGIATSLNGPGAEALRRVVDNTGEGGLLGIAVLPGDTTYLYAYITRADDNAVLRMELNGDLLSQPTAIVEGIPSAKNHDGGRIAFGPDGFLYIATGDAGQANKAADTGSTAGKILRVVAKGGKKDGRAAPGNPWGNRVWSTGHRNVEGLAFVADGRLYASELGQDAWDELNLITAGSDYGWPSTEGTDGLPADGITAPIETWAPDDASPSGLAATHEALYMASLKGERLWRIPLTADGTGEPEVILDGVGRIRDVAVALDGSLYVATSNTDGRGSARTGDDRILRLTVG